MKRILKYMIVVVCLVYGGIWTAGAQNKVTGIVVDKYGSPIPGAMVDAVGIDAPVMTGVDGTFSIELPHQVSRLKFRYGGYSTVSKTVSPEMQVKMRKSNGSHADNWFLSFQIAVPDVSQARPAYGFMAGWCRGFGAYMKGVFRARPDVGYNSSWMGMDNSHLPWYTGKFKASYNCMTWGGMMNLYSPVYVYAGLGWAMREVYHELSDGKYMGSSDDSYTQVALDLGVMCKLRSIMISAGLTGHPGYGCVGNFGVGYCF